MKKLVLCSVISLLSFSSNAQEQLRLMFYNLFEYPEELPVYRAPILKRIVNDIDPDLFLVCELQSEEGADNILYEVLNYHPDKEFKRAPFVPNQSNDYSELQQLAFYNSKKLELIATEIFPTVHRDINKYKFKLKFEENQASDIYLYAFVCHLKSSPGRANRLQRLEMTQIFTEQLEYIEDGAYVVFAGDFNFYNSEEEAYQEILSDSHPILLYDPLFEEGNWHENPAFQHIHTQATRASNRGFSTGASGGMDDRFDFIFLSKNLQDTSSLLYYVPDSYYAYGNNENCYKKSINDPSCTGVFSAEQREDLYWMSDHLPVVLELESQQAFLNVEDFAWEEDQIQILQNPTQNKELKIFIPETHLSQELAFDLYNLLGQKVWALQDKYWTSESHFNLEFLDSGIYYLKIAGLETQSIKLILN